MNMKTVQKAALVASLSIPLTLQFLSVQPVSAEILSPETSGEVRAQKSASMGGGSGEGKATLYRNGNLVVEGYAVSTARTTATRTSIFVVGVDTKGRSLFVSKKFDVPTACAKWDASCSSKRRATFQQQISGDLAQYVARLDVYVADRGSGGVEGRLKQFVDNIKSSCAAYDDLPAIARAAIAYETGFPGCNPK